MKVVFIIISLFCISFVFGQKKEHEQRVEEEVIPQRSIDFIKQLTIDVKHPRWYRENTSGKESYEVKFIHEHGLHSIEFDSTGLVEDVEVLKKKKEINPKVLKSITNELSKTYDKSRIVKIQQQYSADTALQLIEFLNGGNMKGVLVKYEIEFEAKLDDTWKMYEGTFDESGQLESSREIILRSTENLNY